MRAVPSGGFGSFERKTAHMALSGAIRGIEFTLGNDDECM